MKSKFKTLYTLIIVLTLVASMFLTGCAASTLTEQGAPSGTAVEKTKAAQMTAEPEAETARMSYVSIDINPSIELALLDGAVAEVKAYNDDGAAIILTNSLVGLAPEQAVSALVGSFASEGYISEGEQASIVITVAGEQEEGLAETLKQNAKTSLKDLGLECDVVTTYVAEEIVQTAENCGLSIGRYLIIKQIASQQGISLDEARDKYGALKMNELLGMIEDIDDFMEDIQQVNSALDSLTPEQLQMLNQARSAFQERMRAAQRAFLAARTQAKNAFQTARDEAKGTFLAGKDKDLLKVSKKQIKDSFALAKKTATNTLKQAKIKAREDFAAAIAGFGLDQETIDQLLEWNFDTDFDVDMDFGFEDETEDETEVETEDEPGVDAEDESKGDKDTDNSKGKSSEQGRGGKGKAGN